METIETNQLTVAIIYDIDGQELYPPGPIHHIMPEPGSTAAVAGIASSLTELGHRPVMAGDFYKIVETLGQNPNPGWDLAISVVGGVRGVAKEAQVPAILEAYGIPHAYSDSLAMAICGDKARTKEILSYHNIPTAPFAIIKASSWQHQYSPNTSNFRPATSAVATSRHRASLSDSYPLFAKPAAEHTSRGIIPASKIRSAKDLEPSINELHAAFPDQDILLETFLPGREFTVAIRGDGEQAAVFGTIEMVWVAGEAVAEEFVEAAKKLGNVDFATLDLKPSADRGGLMKEILADRRDPVVRRVEQVALDAWKVLGCRDIGRVDIRCDRVGADAVPFVMEVNPVCGMIPHRSQLPKIAEMSGYCYTDLIEMIVEMVLARCAEGKVTATQEFKRKDSAAAVEY